MKTKLFTGPLSGKSCLSVCQGSGRISKKSSSLLAVPREITRYDECFQRCDGGNVSTSVEIYTVDVENDEVVDQQELPNEQNSQLQQSLVFIDSRPLEKMDSAITCTSNMETIFSPALDPVEIRSIPNIDDNAGGDNNVNVPRLGTDDSDNSWSSCDFQTCNVSDFFISDMIITSIPFDGDAVIDDIIEVNPFPDFKFAETSVLFDVAEECMMLPFLEDTPKMSNNDDMKSCEESMIDADKSSLYLAINQIRSWNQESGFQANSGQAEELDPRFCVKNLPELSDGESKYFPALPRKECWMRKSKTLVLDLDETLVHSTLEHSTNADFTFTVFFNMKEHTVYVKQRPHLHRFLEKVAEMFEVVIFTASQSIYAAQLLDILDPDEKLISRRIYRESCIFTDGSYAKDLTVLGVDLAKVAIIDNSPQVFRLQIDNGIPIKSWFSDPSDCALISLLPFLETLVDADDVRPIIAKKFGNKG